MPISALRPCAAIGCPVLVEAGYCINHRKVQAEHAATVDRDRPNAYRRGYNKAWAKRRYWHLRCEPLCRSCGAPANEVDHIIPKVRGGTDDEANLQSLCKRCHTRKTNAERKG